MARRNPLAMLVGLAAVATEMARVVREVRLAAAPKAVRRALTEQAVLDLRLARARMRRSVDLCWPALDPEEPARVAMAWLAFWSYLAAETFAGAAKALDTPEATVRFRISKVSGPVREKSSEARFATVRAWAAERGLLGFDPVLPGFAVNRTTTQLDADGEVSGRFVTQAKAPGARGEVPAGHVVKGVSQLLDAEGRVTQQWVKTREGRDPLDVAEAIKAAFVGYRTRHKVIPAPAAASADLMTLLPLADWHIGAHSWGRETGIDWDLRIAEEVIGRAVENVVERSPASGLGVVLGGGDLMHADGQDNRTAKSGNQLDVEGRYDEVFEVAARMTVRIVDAMLRRHERVLVRILKGNHDHHCSVAIAHHLKAWYRNEPRVEVDIGPGLFWYHRFGKLMLASIHGHETKSA